MAATRLIIRCWVYDAPGHENQHSTSVMRQRYSRVFSEWETESELGESGDWSVGQPVVRVLPIWHLQSNEKAAEAPGTESF